MKLKFLIIHCAVNPEGRVVSSGHIRQWHLDLHPAGRGWSKANNILEMNIYSS